MDFVRTKSSDPVMTRVRSVIDSVAGFGVWLSIRSTCTVDEKSHKAWHETSTSTRGSSDFNNFFSRIWDKNIARLAIRWEVIILGVEETITWISKNRHQDVWK